MKEYIKIVYIEDRMEPSLKLSTFTCDDRKPNNNSKTLPSELKINLIIPNLMNRDKR